MKQVGDTWAVAFAREGEDKLCLRFHFGIPGDEEA